MDLSKLFEMQRELDERIVREKGLEGQNLLPNKILALQVELGELANEARFFKYWSNDQEPRTFERVPCPTCNPNGGRYRLFQDGSEDPQEFCETCAGYKCIDKNPLLEEFADCLHFILSIGLELGIKNIPVGNVPRYQTLIEGFLGLFKQVSVLATIPKEDVKVQRVHYSILLDMFVDLGEMLGFSWEEVEEAYIRKNTVNHERQNNGY